MKDRTLRNLLKARGFSTQVAKEIERAVEKKTLKEAVKTTPQLIVLNKKSGSEVLELLLSSLRGHNGYQGEADITSVFFVNN